MRLSQFYQASDLVISCEFFPPKTEKGEASLWQCVEELKQAKPQYFSVTYGAGGSTQERTKNIVGRIKRDTLVEPVAHLTCVGSTRDQISSLLAEYQQMGIENILALRGDPPEGEHAFVSVNGGFSQGSELVEFVRGANGFGVGVATYPEGHPESPKGVEDDLEYLKLKQDMGADVAITQFFFDNDDYYSFCERAKAIGVTIPIVPGIIPINNIERIMGFAERCGAKVPADIRDRLMPLMDDPGAMNEAGIRIAIAQCKDLIAHGVPGLHFYCLNKSGPTLKILYALGLSEVDV